MQTNNIDNITLEARKAYRFLFEYQSRILDLMKFIQSNYDLKYYGGLPMFSDAAPQKGRGDLDNWSWDWLNMYYYQFSFFYNNDKSEETGKFFSAFIINDTGYYESLFAGKITDTPQGRLDINSFKAAEESQTRLIFVANKGKWETQKHWQSEDIIFNSQSGIISYDKGLICHKSYNLSEFINQDSALEQLTDFSLLCQRNGIDIKIKEDNPQNSL